MKMRCNILGATSFGLLVAFTQVTAANAAEIKMFTSRAIATVLDQIGPQFEQTTGHKLSVIQVVGPALLNRIDGSEPFDIVVATRPVMEGLIKSGKIIAQTHTNLVRSGLGVGVRAGAPKPDIASVEAFKRAMLDAKSIAYLRGGSGALVHGILERIGIADAIRSKVTRPAADIASELVAKGEIEIVLVVTTQIVTTPGVELVGPFPPEIQSYLVFSGGVSSISKSPDAARDLLKFLTGPTAIPVIKSQAMEPG